MLGSQLSVGFTGFDPTSFPGSLSFPSRDPNSQNMGWVEENAGNDVSFDLIEGVQDK